MTTATLSAPPPARPASRTAIDERLTRLMVDYQRRIFRFVYAMVGSEILAEDLTQDVFLLVYRALGRLPADANESAWLFAIARNRTVQELRRRRILRWVPLAGPGDGEEMQPDEAKPLAEAVADRDELRRAMEAVPRKDLTCLLLSIDGHTYDEVATITGLSTAAVRARIFRARDRLRNLLSAEREAATAPVACSA